MKKTARIFAFLTVFVFVLSSFNVFAAENIKADISVSVKFDDTALNFADENSFNESVASDASFINLVVQAAQKKGKDVSLDGVRPDRSIKLYGVKGAEYNLQSFNDNYLETGKIKNLLSTDYSLLTLYVNKDGEYVDSLIFTRKENLPDSADKNGWVMLGSGSAAMADDIIVKYSKSETVTDCAKDLGLNNVKEFKFVSAVPNMPVSIYFVQSNTEFIIPLDDSANMKAAQVYKVSDMMEKYLSPVLDYQNAEAKKYSQLELKDRPVGKLQVPDNLPEIKPIDLHTYFVTKSNAVKENKSTDLSMVVISASVIVLLLAGCGIVYIIKRKKKNNKTA